MLNTLGRCSRRMGYQLIVNSFSLSNALRIVGLLIIAGAGPLAAEENANPLTLEQRQLFENQIRPLLVNHCLECHGAETQEAGLRLDAFSWALRGGDNGPALDSSDLGTSLLMRAVRYDDANLQMPPTGKLSAKQIQTLEQWIAMGAPWPEDEPVRAAADDQFEITDEDRQFWAFQPIEQPAVPPQRSLTTSANPIDRFVDARLQEQGLSMNPTASRRVLIRRLYFDLIGLPPTAQQVDQFERDRAPDAYNRLVDQLLASPRYGERWGRHWLDVVRFAQTNGYERDDEKPYAWRFRDYVISAFNQDKPFDRFVVEQLAGDELDKVTDDSITATGFFRLGVWDDEPDDKQQALYDSLDDMVVTTGAAFMGMTIGCCRCHDHKFDPLSQEDYYSTLAFVRNVSYYVKHHDGKADTTIFASLPSGRGKTLAVREDGVEAPPTHVLIRGNPKTPAQAVQPRFPQVFGVAMPESIAASPGNTSGRRRVLAEWIVSGEHPLTARVIVNRLWQHHFGLGLVATPNDFGQTGMRPTHPQLLDWLATELMQGDWSLKRMHRLILTSHAFRQSSASLDPQAIRLDPKNRMLWRQNLKRLEAEVIRDSILAASGALNLQMEGPSIYPEVPPDVIGSQSMPGRGWGRSPPDQRSRRSVYVFSKRGLQVPLLESFDFASSEQPIGQRNATTVAPQALTLLNSDFIAEQVEQFADRLLLGAGTHDPSALVEHAYQLALARSPSEEEMAIAVDYFKAQLQAAELSPAIPTLTPKLPSALHKTFMDVSRAEDYLDGPRQGWSYAQGDWPHRGDGIHWVRLERGPFALWDQQTAVNGSIKMKLLIHPNAELAGIIFRAKAREAVFDGYELVFLPEQQELSLRRISDHEVTLATAPMVVEPGQWFDLQIDFQNERFKVAIDDQEFINVIDNEPVLHAGKFGLRTWVAGLSFRDVQLMMDEHPFVLTGITKIESHERARRVLCNLMLNLNEFVYVD
ncbi:MAG: hypothetical protein CMJ77_15415 [Planctomycetaceae bacterium]|nr:hypothetical protein [Planctomycetaceae bacterium]